MTATLKRRGDVMSTCAFMNCLGPVSGLALICDPHKAQRVKECRQTRAGTNYKPQNQNCTYGYHQAPCRDGKCFDDHWDIRFCAPCEKCHYCGQVHPMAAAA